MRQLEQNLASIYAQVAMMEAMKVANLARLPLGDLAHGESAFLSVAEKLRQIASDTETDEVTRLSQKYGIYAVPYVHAGVCYWKPRMRDGTDPDYEWMTNNQPTHSGWHTLLGAVWDLGKHLEQTSAA